ncbi:DUF6354 family protein [Noviherbaspirillum suwonense]|uniref:Uncharacterized protein n=1 Tax=Noviherbaspirillum suwonense TaxID=1224511 RepID=A0ABY1QLK7_9BURK|nr:DUF6354 family protein [Noviherbaspirillum suwonense]SMP71731.1 hypothetical protein SAMN06295970_11762 [Noviherbaspirillum suwonense]
MSEIPKGWKLVPEDPDQAMCQAAQWKLREWPKFPFRVVPAYKAMLAAAPAQPETWKVLPSPVRVTGEMLHQAFPEIPGEPWPLTGVRKVVWERFAERVNARLAAPTGGIHPVTKDGTEVKVGQVWQDMDPRMDGRQRRIYAIEGEKVVMGRVDRDTGGKTKVSISRLRPVSGGWKLVPTGEPIQEAKE